MPTLEPERRPASAHKSVPPGGSERTARWELHELGSETFSPAVVRADIQPVVPAPDDWRRMGQEAYLRGATLTWSHYRALSGEWEHEHCQFCFRKFLDADYSPLHAEELRQDADRLAPAGYTNVEGPGRPAGKYWICDQCFSDFQAEFVWAVVATDPDAWPYQGTEPAPRPMAADYDKTRWIESPTGRSRKRPE